MWILVEWKTTSNFLNCYIYYFIVLFTQKGTWWRLRWRPVTYYPRINWKVARGKYVSIDLQEKTELVVKHVSQSISCGWNKKYHRWTKCVYFDAKYEIRYAIFTDISSSLIYLNNGKQNRKRYCESTPRAQFQLFVAKNTHISFKLLVIRQIDITRLHVAQIHA